MREKRRLKVFENRVLRRIFGSKKDEVTGEWRRLRNEEHYALYLSNIFRVIKSGRITWAGHVERKGDRKGAYMGLARKPERKIPLGRPKCRWEDTIKNVSSKNRMKTHKWW